MMRVLFIVRLWDIGILKTQRYEMPIVLGHTRQPIHIETTLNSCAILENREYTYIAVIESHRMTTNVL